MRKSISRKHSDFEASSDFQIVNIQFKNDDLPVTARDEILNLDKSEQLKLNQTLEESRNLIVSK